MNEGCLRILAARIDYWNPSSASRIIHLVKPKADLTMFTLRSSPPHRVPVQGMVTGVNHAGDAGDTPPAIFWLGGTSTGISPPILLRTFGYSRPILVALRSLSLKPFSFGCKTPPVRFSQAGGQSAHKARPPNLELALMPLGMVHSSGWPRG